VSEEILEENNQQNESIESSSDEDTQQEIVEDEGDDNIASVAKQSDNEETDVEKEEKDSVEAPEEVVDSTSNDLLNPPTINDDLEGEDIVAKEAEIARLSAEVERLRHSMSGAADIIEEMENPPMPPMIQEDVVIGAHIVADMARMARQLDRDQLIRASMGTIAMLHPERFDVLISTKHKSLLPRMNEKDICAGKLNSEPPRGAPTDWRVLEVLLASTNIVTGGPAAVIHCHGPYSTAVSCEKDLVLMQPIDEIGKEHIGKVIIVDPDDENPREYLRQVAEALKQGGMRCVVIRGNGAYAVGADLDQAWANAAMLEHSMKIVMLARQANLKI
jgi:ribulose-5-phosphate 4-epimerase/fuculose-1-phosphate aldolase